MMTPQPRRRPCCRAAKRTSWPWCHGSYPRVLRQSADRGAVQAAATDRRMTRAHVTIQLGGIMAAVQVFQTQGTPNVLLVESMVRVTYPFRACSTRRICQPTTRSCYRLSTDVILYRELIRQGSANIWWRRFTRCRSSRRSQPLLRSQGQPRRARGFLRRRQGRRWFVDYCSQLRLADVETLRHRYGHHRSRSRLRNSRPQLHQDSSNE